MSETVVTTHGSIGGVREDDLLAFRGIPYAQPPVGPLRFCAPREPEPWTGVRPAHEFGPSAPQLEMNLAIAPGMGVGPQAEDCLSLNVFRPASVAPPRPVLVWIHGGAFTTGSGSQPMYDGRRLALRGDCVLVSINYRLGALGFLDLSRSGGEAFGATANAGILDQVAALRWVRDNIAAFGGDPQNVTIFGESAGGMCVGTLLGLPAAQGLFQRAVAQSGAAHTVASADEAEAAARVLLEELGLARGDAAALRDVSVERLLDAQHRTVFRVDGGAGVRAFRPSIDGRTLVRHPFDEIRDGLARDVSLLVGACRDEARLFGFIDREARKLDAEGLQKRVELRLAGAGGDATAAAREMIDAYRAAEGADATPGDLYFAIETDRVYRIPAVRLAEAQHRHQRHTYAYLVTWPSPLAGGSLGACHGIDLPFVFGTVDTKGGKAFVGEKPAASTLSRQMMDAWISFARCGDPNHPGLPLWPSFDTAERRTMIFDDPCEVVSDPGRERREAWSGRLRE